jgi:hypothetical protein
MLMDIKSIKQNGIIRVNNMEPVAELPIDSTVLKSSSDATYDGT